MRWMILGATVVVSAACVEAGGPGDGCGGATCPFAEPVAHAIMRGTVTRPDGTPRTGLPVTMNTVASGGSCTGLASTATDADGRYSMLLHLYADLANTCPPNAVPVRVIVSKGDGQGGYVVGDSARLNLPYTLRDRTPAVTERSFVVP